MKGRLIGVMAMQQAEFGHDERACINIVVHELNRFLALKDVHYDFKLEDVHALKYLISQKSAKLSRMPE